MATDDNRVTFAPAILWLERARARGLGANLPDADVVAPIADLLAVIELDPVIVGARARAHGATRARAGTVSLGQLAAEYSLLRQLLPEKAERLDQALAAATAEFVRPSTEEELNRVFEQAPLPIAVLNGPKHTFRLANLPYRQYAGRDVVGRAVRDVFSEDDGGGFYFALLDQVYETGVAFEGQELEFKRLGANGRPEHAKFNLVLNPYRDASGAVTGVLVFIYDVTDLVVARQEIQASEGRLRSAFAHAAVGFLVSDTDGKILIVNPRFCEICGYGEDELLGRQITEFIHSEDREREREQLGDLNRGNLAHFIIEKRIVQKSAASVFVRMSVSATVGPHGERLIIRVAEDVSAAREAERLRAESEARYVRLAESMPQIVWTATPDGKLDYFNQIWFTYSGVAPSEDLGARWVEHMHPADVERTGALWRESIRLGVNYETEFRLRDRHGIYRWHVSRAVPYRDPRGRITAWFGTSTDVDQFKRLTQELERAKRRVDNEQQKFEAIFADSATSMAVLRGPEFVYEIANPSYLSLFNNREIVGKPFLIALPELEGQAFPRHAQEVFDTGVPYRDAEARAYLSRVEGGVLEERFFDQTYSRMLDLDGQPYGVFIHAVEVTDRVRSRRELEQSAERLRLAIETANMGTWDLDPQTLTVYWSPRSSEIFGAAPTGSLSLEEAVRRIHPEDRPRVEAAIAGATDPRGNGTYAIEYRIVHDDRSVRWVSLLGRSFFGDSPEGRVCVRFTGTMLDVTDRRLAEVALREAKERAESANAAKSAFLANMSHEIRTPLGAIMGFVSLIKDEELSPQMLLNYVSVIERNSVQLMRIIDDILDLSKVEAGMMMIEHINFSLIELLSDFSSLMGFRARERGILFELKAKTELPDIVRCDPTRVRQILTNIVGNAIKFTERGSVQLFVSYRDGFLILEVQDTGRGIAPHQAEHLFQPFSQGDVSTTRKFGGTGLGLVLTRRLSEALGGNFELSKSIPGQGSLFTARVKVDLEPRTKFIKALGFAPEPIRNAGVTARLRDLKVLLVEDSPDNQALYSIYLSLAGAKIDIAADGKHGYEMAQSGEYDVVLMDVQMPIMDGITAVKRLREQGYPGIVIALTAHAMKEERVRCIEAGYDDFLSKPVQRSELIETLMRYRPPT